MHMREMNPDSWSSVYIHSTLQIVKLIRETYCIIPGIRITDMMLTGIAAGIAGQRGDWYCALAVVF